MSGANWAQAVVFLVVVTLLVRPLGGYMARVFAGERTVLDPALRPLERLIFRVSGVDARREMAWPEYAASFVLLPLSLAGGLVLVWQGVPMTFGPHVEATGLEGAPQVIARGPVAALEVIKNLGTNGGASSTSTPPTPTPTPPRRRTTGPTGSPRSPSPTPAASPKTARTSPG
jgi:K+-transporting ATPase A subunit